MLNIYYQVNCGVYLLVDLSQVYYEVYDLPAERIIHKKRICVNSIVFVFTNL